MRRLILLTISGPLLLSLAFAQQAASPSQQPGQLQPKPITLPHLYWHLMTWQNHLDKAAAEHEKNGKDGTWLRGYLQKQLRFSDAEFAPVRESAQRLALAVADLDAQAKSLVQADLALYANGKLASSDPPPNLAKVKQLSQQREDVINAEIARLNAALGPDNAAKLKTYLTQDHSSHVTAKVNPNAAVHPRPYGPSLQALGLEAQP
ncbi:MAG: hypothetical protein ABSD59_22860 [Terracidiphilus sp.]|jgi:hypothetical protein